MSQESRTTPTAVNEVPRTGDVPAESEYVLPASSAQQRLWFIDGLRPGHPVYNIPAAFDLVGRLDLSALERGLNHLISRHESLRTSFRDTSDGFSQVVAAHATVPFAVVDLGMDRPTTGPARRDALIAEFARRPFDLSREPLIDVTVLRWGPDDHTLLLSAHHIIADGWSIGVLCRELSHLYGAYVTGSDPLLVPLDLQYADYAVWQRKRLDGGAIDPQIAYWTRQLAGAPPAIDLPADHPRPVAKTYEGGAEWLHLTAERFEAIKELARRQQVTPFVVLLAACSVLLSRYAGTTDVVVGTPVADRFRAETEAMVGFLVNTVVLRCDLSGDPTGRELLARLRDVVATAMSHHELPFDRLVEVLRPPRELGRPPVVQVMVAFQPDPLEAFELTDIDTTPRVVHNGTAKFDLHFGFEESRGGVRCMLEYSTDLFEAATVRRMAAHLDVVLEAFVAGPDDRVSELPMVTPAEQQRALVDWNDTARDFPATTSVSRLFEARAAAAPDAIAVSAGGEHLTYSEVNRRSNRLAAYLGSSGVAPADRVAVCLERSADFVVAMLAVLKAGGAYVPLDPGNPAPRLQALIDDAAVAAVLTHRPTSGIELYGRRRIDIDQAASAIASCPDRDPATASNGEDLAYVMYTSGSTGHPKGVAIPHRAIVRLVVNTNYVAIGPSDVVAQVSNQAFDAATFEIWGALLNGARLEVIDRETIFAPGLLAQAIRERRLTTMFLTSALFNAIAAHEPAAFAPLAQLLVGGDVVEPKWAAEVLRYGAPRRLLNGYGPTETTTFAAWHEIDEATAAGASIPIGRPIANTTLYVLDDRMMPAAVGVTGELYIGGPGLAHGYLNDEGLTRERFVTAPFAGGGRLYRSGDAARYRPDGTIEFRGRLDTQVKLRGFRVEPGEVEATISRHPLVASATVVVREDEPAGKRLVAYVVGVDAAADPLGPAIRDWLETQLPDYMLPVLVQLPALPLTPNGKVDRNALPAPAPPGAARTPSAPRTATETAVADIWAEVLKLDEFGIDDSFFDLGGHSLAALRLFVLIHQQFGVRLPLATLFEAPTVARLAAILDASAPPAADNAVVQLSLDIIRRSSCLVAIRASGTRPPLFVLPGAGGNILGFQGVAGQLDPDQPVIGLESLGLDGREIPLTSLPAIAARFISEMRSLQAQGPYALGGISFGGMVALEMAQQLLASGQRVALLALLDTMLPSQPSEGGQSGSSPARLNELARRFQRIAGGLIGAEEGGPAVFLRTRARRVRARLEARRWRRHDEVQTMAARIRAGEPLTIDETLRNVRQSNLMAFHAYRPTYYDDDITLFFATDRDGDDNSRENWRALSRRLIVRPVPGNHSTMLEGANVRVLARELDAALGVARAESRRPES